MRNFVFNSTVKQNGAFTRSTTASNFYQLQLTLRYSF
jgi:hypothetical protein